MDADGWGSYLAEVAAQKLLDFARVLVGDGPNADLDQGAGWDHRLDPVPLIAAVDAIDGECGTDGDTLVVRIVGFAPSFGNASVVQDLVVFGSRAGHVIPFAGTPYAHLVVEAWDNNSTLGVMQAGD